MIRLGALVLAFLAGPAAAQVASLVADAPGAVLRGLDKIDGRVDDITLTVGETARFGRLQVTLEACRYPRRNPAGDAYAWLTIRRDGGTALFEGWMIASSPALSALDDPRYDVWVMRCTTS